MITFSKWPKLQQRLGQLSSRSAKKTFVDTHLKLEAQRAQFLSKTGPGASGFLICTPSDPALTFCNDDFQLALRLWLRLPILPQFGVQAGLACCCSRTGDSYNQRAPEKLSELHLINCQNNGVLKFKHDGIKLVLAAMLRAADLQPIIEPLAGVHENRRLRFDIAVDRADGWNRDVKLDVSVRSPLAKKLLAQTSKHPLYAAQCGFDAKHKHYDHVIPNNSRVKFIPLVMESFGAFHPELQAFIATVSARANDLPPDSATFTASTFAAYWSQRLSVCLQKENALAIRATILRTKEQYNLDDEDIHDEPGVTAEEIPAQLAASSDQD